VTGLFGTARTPLTLSRFPRVVAGYNGTTMTVFSDAIATLNSEFDRVNAELVSARADDAADAATIASLTS